MATFKFGVTQEDVEKEEAQRIRELEYKVQERTRERNLKLKALNKKNKRNRYIILFISIIFFVGMLTFGTYNTFFKTPITESDVQTIIDQNSAEFNYYGVEGFLHDSIKPMFAELATISAESSEDNENAENTTLEKFDIDPNSVRVIRIMPITSDTAIVVFKANLNAKEADHYEKENDEDVLVKGKETYNNYQFRVLLKFENNGYHFVSELELQPMILKDDLTTVEESEYLQFEEDSEVDASEKQVVDAQKYIDRILADLYEGKDVGSDFEPKNKFNTKDNYLGITEFHLYSKPNQLGYNAVCIYDIESIDKLLFTNKAYLKVEKDGDSWKILNFL